MCNIKQYKEYKLSVIINKKLKHSYLSVTKEGTVKIKTPSNSEQFIHSFIDDKEQWIQKQLRKIENCIELSPIQLHSIESVKNRVAYFAQLMSLHYEQLKFRKMKRRWGSCNSTGVITLNKALFFVEDQLLDYVIVHELAHLQYMNHSKKFHAFVAHYLPKEQEYRKALQEIRLT